MRTVSCAFIALLAVGIVIPDAEIRDLEVASAHTAELQGGGESGWLLEFESPPPPSTPLGKDFPQTVDPPPVTSDQESPAGIRDLSDVEVHTTAPPPATPVQRAMNRLAELGANAEELRFFDCLMWFESNYRWWVTSPWQDYGLLQINQIHRWRWAGRDIFDPVVNAEVAWDIYKESGFRAWSAAKFCYR